jgi:cyclic pyranopterin phosphate synthase
MPAEGVAWLPGRDLLTDEEISRLIGIAVTQLGVTEVRFTGGEPLLRPGLVAIVARAAALRPRPALSLTTNGIGLAARAAELRAAGLDRVNVSLDTLSPERFLQLTRRDRHAEVLAGLSAAAEIGLGPVKINSVLVRGINEDEAAPLLRFALDHGYQQRFIEQMPLDAGHTWSRDRMVTASEILTALEAEFTLLADPGDRGGAPAETWVVGGYPGEPKVGVIASVTRPFCHDCDRTRLTADGQIRNCLFSSEETDLRGLLRGGGSDAEIAERWRAAMWAKLPGHGIADPTFLQPNRPMSAIGG